MYTAITIYIDIGDRHEVGIMVESPDDRATSFVAHPHDAPEVAEQVAELIRHRVFTYVIDRLTTHRDGDRTDEP